MDEPAYAVGFISMAQPAWECFRGCAAWIPGAYASFGTLAHPWYKMRLDASGEATRSSGLIGTSLRNSLLFGNRGFPKRHQ